MDGEGRVGRKGFVKTGTFYKAVFNHLFWIKKNGLKVKKSFETILNSNNFHNVSVIFYLISLINKLLIVLDIIIIL